MADSLLTNRLVKRKLEEAMTEASPAANGPASGLVYSFVPAHGGCKAGAVARELSRALAEGLEAPVLLADFGFLKLGSLWNAPTALRRLDGHTWGAFVSKWDGLDVLDASDVQPRQFPAVLEYAQLQYTAICADLTSAKEVFAMDVLRVSECIFIVAALDPASLEMARDKARWLDSMGLGDRCGLLLDYTPGDLRRLDAEAITGVPLCGLISNATHIEGLAHSIAAQLAPAPPPLCEMALMEFAGAA